MKRKLFKRFIALCAALVLSLGTVTTASAATFTPEQLAQLYQLLLAQQQAAGMTAAVPAAPAIPSGTLIVGDSISALSAPYIQAVMPGAILNARSGRPLCDTAGICPDDGIGVLSSYAASGTMPKKVVVALGSNNNSILGLSPLTFDMLTQVVNICGPNRTIYFVTEYALGGNAQVANNNAQIYLAARTYPNVKVLNWSGKASSHPSYIDALPYDPVTNPNGADPNIPYYVHPTTQGSIAFAQTLAAAK